MPRDTQPRRTRNAACPRHRERAPCAAGARTPVAGPHQVGPQAASSCALEVEAGARVGARSQGLRTMLAAAPGAIGPKRSKWTSERRRAAAGAPSGSVPAAGTT
eukprot:5423166-Prymnesium_polylepis.2